MSKNILRLDTSIRKTNSHSRKLSDKLIGQLTRDGNTTVTIRDLAEDLPLIDENWSNANFTQADERTVEQKALLKTSDQLVTELNNADTIVIGLPIYNFSVPAKFKAWIDQVVRAKLTFQYGKNGPEGLVNNKKVFIIVVSGGTQLNTELDFISDYLKHILGFIGITDISFIDSSGLSQNESTVLANAQKHIASI